MSIGANINTTLVMSCVMTSQTIQPYKGMKWLLAHMTYTLI